MATKKPFAGNVLDLSGLHILGAHAFDPAGLLCANHLFDGVVPQNLDLGVLEQPVLQDLLGPKAVAAVDQRHLGREVRQKQSLFHSRVPAADHDDFLTTVEEPVTGGTGRYAKALEMLLARQTQPLRLGPGGQDHRVGGVGGPAVALCP